MNKIMGMNKYQIIIKSDTATHSITTIAQSFQKAIDTVMSAENCPESAIKEIKCIEKIT